MYLPLNIFFSLFEKKQWYLTAIGMPLKAIKNAQNRLHISFLVSCQGFTNSDSNLVYLISIW